MPRLLHLTDLHIFADADAKLHGVPTRDTFARVAADARTRGPYDRVLITGDFTHDERSESYATVREMLGDWVPICRIVPGNHDDRDLMRSTFRDIVPENNDAVCFSDTLGEWQLIGLDTHDPGQVPGRISAEHVDWFRRELDACNGPVLVCLHHPPISVNSPWMDRIGLQEPQALLEALSSPRVRLILGGHVHHEFQGRIGSADYLTTPSTGLQFEPDSDEPAFTDDSPGYRIVDIEGDAYRTEVVRVNV